MLNLYVIEISQLRALMWYIMPFPPPPDDARVQRLLNTYQHFVKDNELLLINETFIKDTLRSYRNPIWLHAKLHQISKFASWEKFG